MADQLLSAMYYWYICSVFHVKMLFAEPQSCDDENKIRYLFAHPRRNNCPVE